MLIVPVCFSSKIEVPKLSDAELIKRAGDWAKVLLDAGLVKPGADVIYVQPLYVPAGSIFGWVDFAIWSKSNPDFTFLSQFNFFVKRRKKYVLARIGQKHHPELLKKKYDYNEWFMRLDGANFVAGTPELVAQILQLIASRKISF